MELKEAPGGPEASHGISSTLQGVSGNPLVSLKRHVHQGLKVVKTRGRPIAPHAGLIREGAVF